MQLITLPMYDQQKACHWAFQLRMQHHRKSSFHLYLFQLVDEFGGLLSADPLYSSLAGSLILTFLSLIFPDIGLSFIPSPRRAMERSLTWPFSMEKDFHAFTIFFFTDLFIRRLYASLIEKRIFSISFIKDKIFDFLLFNSLLC